MEKEDKTEEIGALNLQIHTQVIVSLKKRKKKKQNQKPDEINEQKMLETRKLKAGRTKPEHKNGGGGQGSNTRWVRPDEQGLTRLSAAREVPVAPWCDSHTMATKANSQPQGAPGKAGAGRAGPQKNSLYESLFLNQ